MEEARKHRVALDDSCWVSPREGMGGRVDMAGAAGPFPDGQIAGASVYGSPATPPDLVVGIDSPEITCRRNQGRADPTTAADPDACPSMLSINAGDLGNAVACESIEFQKDSFFVGGDTISTDAIEVGEGKGLALYQTARFGNFSYKFPHLDPDERLDTTRVLVSPPTIIISSKTGDNAEEKSHQLVEEDKCDGCKRLRQEYQVLWKEQSKTRRDVEDARKENDLKSKECYQAWMSLQELQMELMRKSMHVGSLAVAVEGQVKERTRWFSALREVSEKFELLKLEHVKLSSAASEYGRNLADMAATIQSGMSGRFDLEKAHMELREKFIKESKGRKELYNKVLELKGNIRVFCRCRPLNPEEISRGASTVVDFEFAKDGELSVRGAAPPRKVFKFDSVFGPQADQGMVFDDTRPLVTSVLDGYNVCIFAYGQTGTGKTFTMEGTKEERGVNYRTLEELFRIIGERRGLFRYEISVSALEVYNEQIRDLLLSSAGGGTTTPQPAARRLEIKQVAEGVHHVPGLVQACVNNMSEVWEVLQTGSNARAVGATNCNEHSSRSHCIHCVMVKGENVIGGGECTRSKLWLIDLAGSERVAKTDVQGDRLKEAQSINKSLSALGDVISALATKSPHVPFRNSKLTHLLQDSLGGDSKTLMFVHISPSENDAAETLCSLNFATRVRGVELGQAKKQFDTGEASKCKHMLEKAKQEIKAKDEQMKRMEETAGCLESKMKAKDVTNKNLQDRVKELEAQLLIERKLARQHVDTKIAENQQLQRQQQQQQQQERDPYPSPNNNNRKPLTTTRPDNHQSDVADAVNYYNGGVLPFRRTDVGDNEMSPASNVKSLMKENKPELAEEEPLASFRKKASRFSISATSRRASMVPAPRRDSLIPAPAIRPMEAPPFSLLTIPGSNDVSSTPLPPPAAVGEATTTGSGIPQPRSGTKRFSSILRRSLQKKVIVKTPLQQHAKRGNALDKAGGGALGGRKARRVVVAEADREQHKWKKEKERGWNHGSAVPRNLI